MIDKEMVEAIFMRGLQNFDKYEILSLIEIKIEEDKILNKLQKDQGGNCTYRFIVEGLLFSSGIKNRTNVIFITCNC